MLLTAARISESRKAFEGSLVQRTGGGVEPVYLYPLGTPGEAILVRTTYSVH